MKKLISLSICFFFLAGCAATTKPLYTWKNYSESLYQFKKEPGDETFAAHKQTLHEIIEESSKQETRVPPGVYAELGLMYLKENNTVEAIKFFQLEETTYPESAVLMSRMINAANSTTAKN